MSKLLFNSAPLVAGIDFSNGWVKIVQVELRSGGPRILDISAAPFTAAGDEKASRREFSKIVWDVLKAKPKTVINCVPRQSATVRFFRLPSSDESEIDKMLEFQVTKQLPFSIEDIVIGHKILSTGQDGYSKVMLAVVQRAVLNNQLGLLKSAWLAPAAMRLSTESILNSFLEAASRTQEAISQPYLLIDVDYISTELLICDGKDILFNRAFGHGAGSVYKLDNDSEILAWAKVLTGHIKHSLAAFSKDRTTHGASINRIFVSGGVAKFFKYIQQELQTEFNIPVEYFNVLEQAGAGKDVRIPADTLNLPVSFSSAIGMVINKEGLQIDLIPKELKAKRLRKQKQSELLRLHVLLASLAISLFVLIGARLYYKQMYAKYLDQQLAQMKPYVKKAELIIEKLNLARSQADKDTGPLLILTEIYRIMPQDVNLSMLSFAENEAVILRGTTKVMSRVFEVASLLENSKYFKDVKVAFANKRKTESGESVDFQINCFLKQADKGMAP